MQRHAHGFGFHMLNGAGCKDPQERLHMSSRLHGLPLESHGRVPKHPSPCIIVLFSKTSPRSSPTCSEALVNPPVIPIMSYPYSSAAVFGSTGLVGSFILPTLLAASPALQTTTISRRAPKPASASPPPSNLDAIIETDSAAWASKLSSLSPVPHTVFSAVGTTRAAAGGIQNQCTFPNPPFPLSKAVSGVSRHVHALETPWAFPNTSTNGNY